MVQILFLVRLLEQAAVAVLALTLPPEVTAAAAAVLALAVLLAQEVKAATVELGQDR